ncbi:MAG: Por secretion system protein [Bacteroidaceae bacterium]|nr:Por secretion system protein [Bacteroidaceae bacterium]
MKRIVFILLVLFAIGWQTVYPRLLLGEWKTFMAYGETSSSVFFAGKVYAVSKGSLFSYDPEDGDILTYDIVYPMSDVEISHIAVCESQKTLVIIYENGNIDLMDAQGEVYNMTDLKNSSMTDKTVNSVNVAGDKAYLATNFGVVVLDVGRREIAITYTFNKKVNSTAVSGKYIFVAIPDDGLYRGTLSDNLLDMGKWTRLMTNTFEQVFYVGGTLYGYIPGASLISIDPETRAFTKVIGGTFIFFNSFGDNLVVGAVGKVHFIDSPTNYRTIDIDSDVVHLSYGKSIYWASCKGEGLTGYVLKENRFESSVSPIILNAPKHNLFYKLLLHNNNLYTCGGGIYLNRYFQPGTVQVLKPNAHWQVYQEDNIASVTGKQYSDITSLAIDPEDENHLFASSAGEGLYEFRDGKFVALHTPLNSGISGDYRWPHIIRIDGLAYDKYANLWALCACADSAVTVLTKDNRWVRLPYAEINRKATLRGTFFDCRGWLWAVTPYHAYTGIFILDYNGTIENMSDDHNVFIEQFTNQDGDKLDAFIYCAVEDREGCVWLGTGNGMWLIDNPEVLLAENSKSIVVTQVKVPRNDGTNYADYLLTGITVKAIAIDGANRKWVGTEKNGLYLLSADGIEEIHHFTTENSPLLSDEIQSIAVDDETGIVYIGTPKGLIAYQSDATEAQPSFEESKVRAFPNPVKPDYQGYINIVGLMMDSQVKITDAYGSLIHEGTSVGGSFTWNGRDSKGRRVTSGIYHVMATDEGGKEGIVTKIVMIK